MNKLKPVSYSKERLKKLLKAEAKLNHYNDPDSLTRVGLPTGSCLLSLEKRKKSGEFYKNIAFNKMFRRKYNIDPKKFFVLLNGYVNFSRMFKTRKAMLKFIKKTRRRELNEQQKQRLLQQENTSSISIGTESSE